MYKVIENKVIGGVGEGSTIDNGLVLTFDQDGERRYISKADVLPDGSKLESPVIAYELIDKNETFVWNDSWTEPTYHKIGELLQLRTNAYIILLYWKDDKKSLIEIDEEYYKVFLKNMLL